MFEFLSIVVSAIMAIASQPSPNSSNFVYTAEAKTNSLASSALFIEKIPHPPEKSLALNEYEGGVMGDSGYIVSNQPEAIIGVTSDRPTLVQDLIKHYSAQYVVSAEEMTRIMMCESTGKEKAIGDNGLAYGLFQFHENTFNLFAKEMGEKLEWKNPEHQIKLASWSFANGKQEHWTCYKKTKNF